MAWVGGGAHPHWGYLFGLVLELRVPACLRLGTIPICVPTDRGQMNDETVGPLRLPASFWRAPAVQEALRSRDVSALFREANERGMSQTRIGAAAGFSQGRVSEIIRGTRGVARMHVLERIAEGLSMPEGARQSMGLAPGGKLNSSLPVAISYGGEEPGDDVDRKEFLRAAIGAGAGLAASRYISLADDQGASDLRSALAGPITHYRRMEHAVSSEHLAPAVEAHLALARVTVDQHLRTAGGLSVLAEIAGMTGWLASDRGDQATARLRYGEAVERAQQAHHPLLAAYMVASLGQFETEAGNPRIGLKHIAQAESLLDRSAPDSARAWLSSLRAVTLAQLADHKGTHAALKLADTLTSRQRGEPVWPWVFQFDAAKFASSEAVALGRLGELSAAIAAFEAAPNTAGPKPRALAQMDHAQVLANAGRLDEACVAALAALRAGHSLGSVRVVNRVRSFHRNLSVDGSEMTKLNDALRAVT